jgi:hypothetical protein
VSDGALQRLLRATAPNQRLHLTRAAFGAVALDSLILRGRSRAGEEVVRPQALRALSIYLCGHVLCWRGHAPCE